MSVESDEKYLKVLESIETLLKAGYEKDPAFTDAMMTLTLDKAKIAIKQKYGFDKGRNSTPANSTMAFTIDSIVTLGDDLIINKTDEMTLAIYCKCIDQVRRSVERHRSYGMRGYYDFIKKYV